jgi:putative endonuclease
MSYTVYILQSEANGQYYIGQSSGLEKRLKYHNDGYEKHTSKYIPWKLIWHDVKESRSEAIVLEKKLKNLSRKRIEIFINKYK